MCRCVNKRVNYLKKKINSGRKWPSGRKILGPCQDQYKGDLVKNGNSYTFAKSNHDDINYLKGKSGAFSAKCSNKTNITNPIVIILESPHKKEFCPYCEKALGPAMGKSGKNFVKYFANAISSSPISNYFKNGNYPVVFVNTVQFQTSEGVFPIVKKTRNNNWISEFNTNAKTNNDLAKRIKALKPYAIINLCTKGAKNINFQQCVETNLKDYSILTKQNIPLYTTGTHPSCWWNSNLRVIK